MNARFVWTMAWRESRASLRRLSLLVGSISVGVGALIAINSFSDSLQESVREKARALLGADLVLRGSSPFSARSEQFLRELQSQAPTTELAWVTRFGAMAYVPRTAGTRLVQVSAVEGSYPFYGGIETDPPGEWARLTSGDGALVDPALLAALDARLGDTLALGEGRFTIRGEVLDSPGEVGARAALGPRVFISRRRLGETRLLGFGARAQYEAYLRLPASADAERLAARYRPALAAERVTLRTVAENEENLSRSLARLGRYLGLVALVAVLLGGLGVASAVHVFIKRRIETIAILRCLGAGSGSVLFIYLAQAAFMGLLGTLAGAILGVALQGLLPRVLEGLLPVAVTFRLSWPSISCGLFVGLWVATLFALLPLLAVRRVSPLLVLRRPYEEGARAPRDRSQIFAVLALCGTVVALAALQARSLQSGLTFASGVGVALAVLVSAALALMRGLRRFFPSRGPYVFRQGLANLYRPANQTVMVVLALGFGAFLLDTLFLVEHNLLRDLRPGGGGETANLALFDIQPDQQDAVARILAEAGLSPRPSVPVVPMRILSLKGTPIARLLAEPASSSSPPPGAPHPGALRREYRSTYRDLLTPTERTIRGTFWQKGAGRLLPSGLPSPISVEADLARELGVGVGDEIVWDVQGLTLATRVVHLRELSWARFEPNFFVVFPEGPLEGAPQTFVTLTRVDDPKTRAILERHVVEAFPNVSALDLSQVQQAIEGIVTRVAAVVRFMALFSLATGAVVLMGAVATSRYQRLREAVLLKTLGATRRQILSVAFVEYATIGSLSVSTALVLATGAGWALVRFTFDSRFSLPILPLLALALGILILTVGVGLANSLDFLRQPPLRVLRAE
jgi:putative ABC transport system permease protein